MEKNRKNSRPWNNIDWLCGGIRYPVEFYSGISFSLNHSDLFSMSIKKDVTESKVTDKALERKVNKIIKEIQKERSRTKQQTSIIKINDVN